jgi:predicted flap endonuclease-1-like 5' DNA nuclease
MLAPKSNESPIEYWISLWPTAPFFGVAWRFEPLMPGAALFRPSAIAAEMAAGVANETARAVEKSAEKAVVMVEEAVELVQEAAEAAAEALVAPTEAAVAASGPARPSALYATPPAEVHDLKRIKGVGPKVEAQLNALGVWRLDQLAAFSEAELAWLEANVTSVRSSPLRDDWAAKARALL